jgi:cation transport protein ChaC
MREDDAVGATEDDEPAGGHWVFGYGSLMWRPGFAYLERIGAVLHGRRRAFCIYSVHHRGTPQRPGLVLGLAEGGSVRGSDQTHPQWAGDLAHSAQAQAIAGAQGLSGRNIDYLRDLVMHLRKGATHDEDMETLLADVERLEAGG